MFGCKCLQINFLFKWHIISQTKKNSNGSPSRSHCVTTQVLKLFWWFLNHSESQVLRHVKQTTSQSQVMKWNSEQQIESLQGFWAFVCYVAEILDSPGHHYTYHSLRTTNFKHFFLNITVLNGTSSPQCNSAYKSDNKYLLKYIYTYIDPR